MKLIFTILVFCMVAENAVFAQEEKVAETVPMVQIAAGLAYSSVDLSRYTNSEIYRGHHCKASVHMGGLFYLSGEYSKIRRHQNFPTWRDVDCYKYDLNLRMSFATNNNKTRIDVFTGPNYHYWSAIRTAYYDLDQLGSGIKEGDQLILKRLGLNFGCGITQTLYENIGFFADYRFVFGNAKDYEKVRIMDVMTNIGFTYTIPHPPKDRKSKRYGIAPGIYKWVRKKKG